MIEIEYAQNIIVGVIIHNSFDWYVTDRDYWYLDYTKFEQALFSSGYTDDTLGDYTMRFGIAVLNESNAGMFLAEIADLRVGSDLLRKIMLEEANRRKGGEDLLDFIPCFLVDFDQRKFYSMYPEMIRFEIYVPDGWAGKRADFLSLIADKDKYWIVDGQNLFGKHNFKL